MKERRESPVERQIREAMERGDFDDLPGKGQPLDLGDNPFEEPLAGTMRRILRDNGVTHPLIEARQALEEELESHRAELARARRIFLQNGSETGWQRAIEAFRAKVSDLNRQIKLNNLKAPTPHFHIRVVNIEAEIRRIQEL